MSTQVKLKSLILILCIISFCLIVAGKKKRSQSIPINMYLVKKIAVEHLDCIYFLALVDNIL